MYLSLSMSHSTAYRYKALIKYVRNWPVYFFNKWKGQPPITRFVLRRYGRIQVPKETIRVFKEFFMSDGYEVELLKSYLSAGSVVIDVGANIGMFPIRLLVEEIPDITFFSYEPLPNNFSILQANVSANPAIEKKINIYNAAVLGKKQENLKIYFNSKKDYTDTSSIVQGFEDNYDYTIVPCTTLQEIYTTNHLSHIAILKLDCEGSEYSILYDTPVDIINNIPLIVVETHDIDSERNNINGVKQFLASLGFQMKIKPVTGKINLIWAWK